MASWRAPGSILEAPRLNFGGSGPDFPRFWTSQTMSKGLSKWQTLCHRLVLHHWAVRVRKVVEILPSHRTSASNACASVSWQRWARCSRSGWPAVSPPGGLSIRLPPKVCQRRVELISNWLLTISAGQSRHSFAQFDLSVLTPFLSFPQEPGDHRSPASSLRLLRLVGPSWSIFSAFQPRLKNDIEKTSKKCENRGFGPPKPFPKSPQNRRFNKHAFFHRFL